MRELILDKSKNVLKIKGIHKTTMRDIAKELGVSDGHVRYYFRTKEALLVELFNEMNGAILSLSEPSADLRADFRANLQQSFRIMTEYNFFFLESVQSLTVFPALSRAYATLFEQRRTFFRELFAAWKQQGIFRPGLTDRRLDFLFEQFFILSDSWMRAHYIRHSEAVGEEDIAHYSDVCLQLFEPYFSETARGRSRISN